MKVDDFIPIMEKVARFKVKLEQGNIKDADQQITVFKIYIEDLTNKINTNLLKVV